MENIELKQEEINKLNFEFLEFLQLFLQKLDFAKKEFKNWTFDTEMNYHATKDYWCIDLKFKCANAIYEDSIVIYTSEFDKNSIIENLTDIINKAINILK